jgi:hypothetical protein
LKGEKRFIVRGYGWAEFHADIYEKVEEQLGKVKSTCVGGGRIQHDSANKQILVYGYSVGFGCADHSVAVKLLKEKYPDCKVYIPSHRLLKKMFGEPTSWRGWSGADKKENTIINNNP